MSNVTLATVVAAAVLLAEVNDEVEVVPNVLVTLVELFKGESRPLLLVLSPSEARDESFVAKLVGPFLLLSSELREGVENYTAHHVEQQHSQDKEER